MKRRDVLTFGAAALAAAVTGRVMSEEEGPQVAAPAITTSADGTPIAFEARGEGPTVILVGGAGNNRHFPEICALPMAELLASSFTAVAFDRRGRGDSGNMAPYAVAREVEDIAALIDAVGAPAYLFGHSSGGALVLHAVMAGLDIEAAAVYEVPYSMDDTAVEEARRYSGELDALLQAGGKKEAVRYFLAMTGMPEEMIEGMAGSPYWEPLVQSAPTLAYDVAVVEQPNRSRVPSGALSQTSIPLLAMAGGSSPAWMQEAARAIADAAPRGSYREFPGRDHMIEAEVVAPVLVQFFGSP
ncbi:MAG TPA: alpha/beta hydrolase [Devosiaceae bacterium]|nr:alpha/beta hydrolase [Devosiaceae bacterium]